MVKILITGKDSYVGRNFIDHLSTYKDKYIADELDMTNKSWALYPFSKYDVIYHVAGIAHSDYGHISKEREKLYKEVNTELAIRCARKAKEAGVKQFIFMSSSIAYGNPPKIGEPFMIDASTSPNPSNCYGQSKLDAENGIRALEDDKFKVCIIRSPMIYGKDSKGNFRSLEKIANKFPIFPYINNQRSAIYIKNLVEFVRILIDNSDNGIFFPQNKEYINTSELIQLIRITKGKKLILVKGLGWLIKVLSVCFPKLKKAFANMTYDKDISKYKDSYCLYSLEDSLKDIL